MRDALVSFVLTLVVGGLIAAIGLGFYSHHPFIGVAIGFTILALPLAGYYAVYGLARANILWTIVGSGWQKIVLEYDKYQRTLNPGLRWVGLPGIRSLYKRRMTFFKSTTDEKGNAIAEPHNDPDVSSFKTTRYPYALPFKDQEESHGLHLSGILAVFGIMRDYCKAFFEVSDWYAELNTRILKIWRDLLATISYDDDIVGRDRPEEQDLPMVSARLWEALTKKQANGKSVIEELFDIVGMEVQSVELVAVDPPEGWRDTTLAPYKAEREREAAKLQAQASAALFDDTNQALKVWLADQRAAGNNPTQAQIEAKQDELRQRALAKTSGYQQIHIKGLENATTAVVGGSGAGTGILVGGNNPKPPKGNAPNNPGNNPAPGNPSASTADAALIKAAEDSFKLYGTYPDWDPLKRKPN